MASMVAAPMRHRDGVWSFAHGSVKDNISTRYHTRRNSRQTVPRTFLKQGSDALTTGEVTNPKRTFLLPIDELAATHSSDLRKLSSEEDAKKLNAFPRIHEEDYPNPYDTSQDRLYKSPPLAEIVFPSTSSHESARASVAAESSDSIATGNITDKIASTKITDKISSTRIEVDISPAKIKSDISSAKLNDDISSTRIKGALSSTAAVRDTNITVPTAVRKWQVWRPDSKPASPMVDMGKDNTFRTDQIDIRNKLSEMGVTVTNVEKSKQSPAPNTRDQVSADKPNDSKPPPRGQGFRGRGRRQPARPNHKPQNRSSRWATKAEMAPVDPRKWDRSPWSQKGDDADVNPTWAGNEWDNPCMIDDETSLRNWDGGWAPPPVDWDNRAAFRDGQSTEKIEDWMEVTEQAMKNTPWAVDIDEIVTRYGVTYRFAELGDESACVKGFGEIAPRYWVPESIDSTDPKPFWFAYIESGAPPPADDGDLDRALPWFAKFNSSIEGCHFLDPTQHNETRGIDPNDEDEDQRQKREDDHGSWAKAEVRNAHEIAVRQERKAARIQKKREIRREMKEFERARDLFEKRRCKPQVDVHIRYATVDDLPTILEIWNHHIASGCVTHLTEPMTLESLQVRFHDVMNKHHHFIVACQRRPTPETVIGFAFADDYHSLRGVYRLTASIEFYVAPGSLRLGVGACLLDRTIFMLDSHYHRRDGYEISDPSGVPRGWRTIRDIMLNFSYYSESSADQREPSQLPWMENFLENTMGFQRVMHLEDMGVKDGRNVSLCVFRRRTGADINPADPPAQKVYGDLPRVPNPDEPRVTVHHDRCDSDSEETWIG